VTDSVEERERDFWDHHVPSLAECRQIYEDGPDIHTKAMLDAVSPGPGVRVLDFACGAGFTSAWLAASGADVVGVDVSPVSIRRSSELCDSLGLRAEFREVGLGVPPALPGEQFDALIGRFALHHLDLATYAPLLAGALRPGGVAAFVETMATNPGLRLVRDHLVGRFGIPRLGTEDEHPLTRRDLAFLEKTFGAIEVSAPAVDCFKLVDRQVLKGRKPKVTRVVFGLDRLLERSPRLAFLSYHQVVVLRRT
jgi:SAM-dependent methyltransferase